MTGLGTGYAPVASGTFGSAGACAIALGVWAISHHYGWSESALNLVWILLVLLSGVGCIVWGNWAVEYFAVQARKKGDPGAVVLDEFAGQWLSIVALPMYSLTEAITVLAAQFFLFRLFDVLKPPPARQLEKLPAGWGILFDDLAAAVYANLIGQVIFRFWMTSA